MQLDADALDRAVYYLHLAIKVPVRNLLSRPAIKAGHQAPLAVHSVTGDQIADLNALYRRANNILDRLPQSIANAARLHAIAKPTPRRTCVSTPVMVLEDSEYDAKPQAKPDPKRLLLAARMVCEYCRAIHLAPTLEYRSFEDGSRKLCIIANWLQE